VPGSYLIPLPGQLKTSAYQFNKNYRNFLIDLHPVAFIEADRPSRKENAKDDDI